VTAGYTYIKVEPQDFSATVFDTDDLSTVRGSSLILARAPQDIEAALRSEPALNNIEIHSILASASTLILRCHVSDPSTPTLLPNPQVVKPPKGINKGQWRRALNHPDALPDPLSADKISERASAIRTTFETNAKDPLPEGTDWIVAQLLKVLGKRAGQLNNSDGTLQLNETQTAQVFRTISAVVNDQSHDPAYWRFNFGIVTYQAPAGENVAISFDAIATELHTTQLQKLTCPIPPPPANRDRPHDEVVCALTRILPASSKAKGISESAETRRQYGRLAKKDFYESTLDKAFADTDMLDTSGFSVESIASLERARDEIKTILGQIDSGFDFASSFDGIVAEPHCGRSLSINANQCVVAMDGNGFGARCAKLLSEGIEGRGKLRNFSIYLDTLKAGMLARIITFILTRDEMKRDGVARFETLLWGGDEFAFVLPAWAGWDFLVMLQEEISHWEDPFDTKQKLTIATGAVFAPRRAPIRDVRASAMFLADDAKAHDRNRSLVQVLAFEGIDRVHMHPGAFRSSWLGRTVDPAAFSFEKDSLMSIQTLVQNELTSVGRSALERWQTIGRTQVAKNVGDLDEALSDIRKSSARISRGDGAFEKIEAIRLADGKSNDPLLSLALVNMYFDYLMPVTKQ